MNILHFRMFHLGLTPVHQKKKCETFSFFLVVFSSLWANNKSLLWFSLAVVDSWLSDLYRLLRGLFSLLAYRSGLCCIWSTCLWFEKRHLSQTMLIVQWCLPLVQGHRVQRESWGGNSNSWCMVLGSDHSDFNEIIALWSILFRDRKFKERKFHLMEVLR